MQTVEPILGEKQPSFTSTDAYIFTQTNQLIHTLKHDIIKCNPDIFESNGVDRSKNQDPSESDGDDMQIEEGSGGQGGKQVDEGKRDKRNKYLMKKCKTIKGNAF